jgi:serine-type D-Ala-D-Ala carboxypeptidase
MSCNSASSVNVSPARVARAVDLLREAVDVGAMPGAVVRAYRYGQIFLDEAVGTLDGTRPARPDSIYDLASLTKPMATAASLLTLVEAGRVPLTAAVTDFLGDFAESGAGHLAPVTLRHLLTHTSGLPAWTACYDVGPGQENAVRAILRVPATAPPGAKYEYSCLNFILLRTVIESVVGKPLDEYAREAVFAPLGLTETGYRPDESLRERIAPTVPKEGPNAGETLIGTVHDGNARGIGGVSGNAGLFGTVADVARFGELLRCRSEATLFGAPTLTRILTNQIDPAVGAHTLFFFAQGNGFCPAGDLLSPRAVGHSGYTGTLLTLDPAHDLTVALLSNAVYGDGKVNFLAYRRKFLNALASALE